MQAIIDKAKKIKLAIFDIDGVLTDGTLFYSDTDMGLKAFHAHDGLGLQLLKRSGIMVGIITSHQSAMVTKRMEALEIEHVYQGQREKIPAYEDLITKLNVSDEQVAYTGDDLPDLPLIQRAGLGIAVANARDFVKQYADWHTTRPGGQGAVREICELIMTSQNTLDDIHAEFLLSHEPS